MGTIQLKNVKKQFDKDVVIENLNLEIADGSFTVLVGPSGCGKSTTLRMITGLDDPTEGDIYIDGQKVNDITPGKRDIAMVFQNYALYPTMTVRQNISFGLENKKVPKEERERRVKEICEIVGLTEYLDRKPSKLSGGQRQRVALARAMVKQPKVFLMDEPLSNLDAKLRSAMRVELIELHRKLKTTFVYVTHDQMEAMTLATQICLIENGVLQQYDAPLTVYNRPNNLFVADFVGNPSINFVEAKGKQREDGALELAVFQNRKVTFRPAAPLNLSEWFQKRDSAAAEKAAALKAKSAEKSYVEKSNKDEIFRYHIAKVVEDDYSLQEEPVLTNEDFVLGIRPEAIDIVESGHLDGEIYGAMPTGMESTIKVRVDDFLLTGVVFGSTLFAIGSKIHVDISGDHVMLFDRRSGQCIALGALEV